MRISNRFRIFISSLLCLSFVLATSAYASDVNTVSVLQSIDESTSICWIFDEEAFLNVFTSPTSEELNTTQTLSVQKNIIQPMQTDATDSIQVEYSFDVDGEGSSSPITVAGQLEKCIYDADLSFYTGTLKGSTVINNKSYVVHAILDCEIGGKQRLYAGITMVPEDASGLEDYIFFSIGESVVTQDMIKTTNSAGKLRNMIGKTASNNTEINPTATKAGTYTMRNWAQESFGGPLGINGTAQRLEFYHNDQINRSCVGVKSNTAPIIEHFSAGGSAGVEISELTIGLRGRSSNIPYIVNVHEIPASSDGGEDFIDTSYISYLTGLLSDVFDIAGSYFVPFEILMDALSDNDKVDVSVFTSGTDSSVTFDYNTNPLYSENVNFDDFPMIVTFNLASADPAYGFFAAYSELTYMVTYISHYEPVVQRLSIPAKNAETLDCYIYVK